MLVFYCLCVVSLSSKVGRRHDSCWRRRRRTTGRRRKKKKRKYLQNGAGEQPVHWNTIETPRNGKRRRGGAFHGRTFLPFWWTCCRWSGDPDAGDRRADFLSFQRNKSEASLCVCVCGGSSSSSSRFVSTLSAWLRELAPANVSAHIRVESG